MFFIWSFQSLSYLQNPLAVGDSNSFNYWEYIKIRYRLVWLSQIQPIACHLNEHILIWFLLISFNESVQSRLNFLCVSIWSPRWPPIDGHSFNIGLYVKMKKKIVSETRNLIEPNYVVQKFKMVAIAG